MSKDNDTKDFLNNALRVEIDGKEMASVNEEDMPHEIALIFKALMRNGADLIQSIHHHTGCSVERCFQMALAAQGALYARMSYLASQGKAPEELGGWQGNDEKGIEDMLLTFRVNARQGIDGINPSMRKGGVQ